MRRLAASARFSMLPHIIRFSETGSHQLASHCSKIAPPYNDDVCRAWDPHAACMVDKGSISGRTSSGRALLNLVFLIKKKRLRSKSRNRHHSSLPARRRDGYFSQQLELVQARCELVPVPRLNYIKVKTRTGAAGQAANPVH